MYKLFLIFIFTAMRQFVIADNQDICRAGLKFVLSTFPDSPLVVEVFNKVDLIANLIASPESVVLLDYTLFDFESVNDLLILQMRFEQVDWILFSDELSVDFLHSVLYSSNSFSVLMKDSSIDEIQSAIKESLKGNRFICNYVSNILLDRSKGRQTSPFKQVLTVTEQEILREMALGKTTKDIAASRFVSVHTIMTHRKNIFRKIEVNNVHEATKYAMKVGIVDMAEYYI